MQDSEKLAIAAHLHVLLRRKLGRVTDVEWMVKSADYAQEVIRIARAEAHEDLHEWAGKLEAAIAPRAAKPAARGADAADSRFGFAPSRLPEGEAAEGTKERYVGRLR
jgi:hypothetical protein